MKLYYSTGSCSMSCHIALEEAGLPHEAIEASWDRNENVDKVETLNPLGMVPVLVTDDGKTLTQNAAILEFIADKKPESHLMGAVGTFARAETMQWLSFVAADFHKSFGPLFATQAMTTNAAAQDEVRKFGKGNITNYLKYIDTNLAGKDYITGKDFTVADAYLFTVLGWCKWLEVDTKPYANISAYTKRMLARPAVAKVVKIHDMATEY